LLTNLSEKYQQYESKKILRQIFKGKVEKTWEMVLTADKQYAIIHSSSQRLAGIQYRTIDKDIQEDAFTLILDGSSTAGIKFITANGFTEDLSSEQENNSALVLMVKSNELIREAVQISMNCVNVTDDTVPCTSVDISSALNEIGQNQWAELSVDLRCFSQQGVKFDQVAIPFELRSGGPLALSISNIYFKENAATSASIKCE
jgi:beta-glucosidase